jgi:hypothetical protein
MKAMTPHPLTIDIPAHEIDDLRSRLRHARWVGDLANDDWCYGANEAYLRDFVEWWADSFDWLAAQAAAVRPFQSISGCTSKVTRFSIKCSVLYFCQPTSQQEA